MPKRYLGNIITDTPTAPAGEYQDSAASGVWSLAEANAYTAAGLWPTAGNAFPSYGLFMGGSSLASVDYVAIATTGNASDWGDWAYEVYDGASCASSTRAFYFAGVEDGSLTTAISSVSFVIGSATVDFGDQTHENSYASQPAGLSNATRGVVGCGSGASDPYYINKIQYITMASAGNAIDFGDSTNARDRLTAFASPTRGVFSTGRNASGYRNRIDYITIASTGNAIDFGDVTVARSGPAGLSSSTRGLTLGGTTGSSLNVIDYVTIASTGNAVDFGDLVVARHFTAGCCTETRGVVGGGYNQGAETQLNQIDYVTIASTGNASNFGDLTVTRTQLEAASNAHGGLAA